MDSCINDLLKDIFTFLAVVSGFFGFIHVRSHGQI